MAAGTDMPEVTLSATSLRILKILIGTRPVTVPDVMKALGVTRTAVVDQFRELIAAGLVQRVTAPPEQRRGRPRHLYSAMPSAMLLLFVDAQRIVFPVLWEAVHSVCGEKLAGEVHGRIAAAIVEHYRPYVTERSPAARARQLVKRLVEEGHLVDVSSDGPGRLVVHNRSCGFLAMRDGNRTTCGIHLSGISGVIGAGLRMFACRHDGAPCCSFEVLLKGQSTPTSTVELPSPGRFPFSIHWSNDTPRAVARAGSNGRPASSSDSLPF
jgi:predicted ArsR family transcriptional regulator